MIQARCSVSKVARVSPSFRQNNGLHWEAIVCCSVLVWQQQCGHRAIPLGDDPQRQVGRDFVD